MLSVFETGDATFRLSNSRDEEVGWIKGGALGFGRLPTEADAIEAALAGGDALAGYLDRLSGASQPSERSTGKVKVVHDGAYEWVTRGGTPIARLYRPDRDPAQRKQGTFAVEFVLPSYVKDGTTIAAAQVVHHAITRLEKEGREVPATKRKAATAPSLGSTPAAMPAVGGRSGAR